MMGFQLFSNFLAKPVHDYDNCIMFQCTPPKILVYIIQRKL